MYDAFSPDLLTPDACTHGCAKWSDKDSSIWIGGKVPSDAGNKCAHVASQVNSKTLGAWCMCADSNLSTVVGDPHPLDGMTMVMKEVNTKKYVSFAYTAGPSGVPSANNWLRADYSANTDAVPWKFKAVMGADDTYTLESLWPGYEKWLDFTWTNNYMRVWTTEGAATPVKFVAHGDGTYVLLNEYPDQRAQGLYVNLDKDTWLQSTATDVSDAMVFSLEPPEGPGGNWGYCVHGDAVPEQINIQIADKDSVVAAFITFESEQPTEAPIMYLGLENHPFQELKGVTHVHQSPKKDRTYYMHFVRAAKLSPRERYSYKVRSGGKNSVNSSVYSFRAPYASGETKISIFGDMGIYEWNNLQQLHQDCVNSTESDLIVHMGDISYNMGDGDEARADGFFNAFQETIANCPWLPNVGNHEYYAGEELARYLDGTWQKWGPIAGGDGTAVPAASTASSALGAFLTTSAHHGPGTLGSHPSNTSRYFSVDLGLVHLIALDLNMYFGVDPCGSPCKAAQLQWLEDDLKLANTNRENVPWVLAFSHYPMYCSGCNSAQVSAPYYSSDEAEICGNGNATASAAFAAARQNEGEQVRAQLKVSANSNGIITDLQPLFDKYSLDLYLGGHWHYYESLFPLQAGNKACQSCATPTQTDFNSPKSTVHVTTGNGGPPGKDTFCESGSGAADCGSIPATRKQTNEFSSGRVIAHNRTHLTFQQILNSDSSLFDEWTIYQPLHPFAPQGAELLV